MLQRCFKNRSMALGLLAWSCLRLEFCWENIELDVVFRPQSLLCLWFRHLAMWIHVSKCSVMLSILLNLHQDLSLWGHCKRNCLAFCGIYYALYMISKGYRRSCLKISWLERWTSILFPSWPLVDDSLSIEGFPDTIVIPAWELIFCLNYPDCISCWRPFFL